MLQKKVKSLFSSATLTQPHNDSEIDWEEVGSGQIGPP